MVPRPTRIFGIDYNGENNSDLSFRQSVRAHLRNLPAQTQAQAVQNAAVGVSYTRICTIDKAALTEF